MSLTSYRAAPSRVIRFDRVKSPVLIDCRLRRRGLLHPASFAVAISDEQAMWRFCFGVPAGARLEDLAATYSPTS